MDELIKKNNKEKSFRRTAFSAELVYLIVETEYMLKVQRL